MHIKRIIYIYLSLGYIISQLSSSVNSEIIINQITGSIQDYTNEFIAPSYIDSDSNTNANNIIDSTVDEDTDKDNDINNPNEDTNKISNEDIKDNIDLDTDTEANTNVYQDKSNSDTTKIFENEEITDKLIDTDNSPYTYTKENINRKTLNNMAQ